jgi:hypothetical protein
MVTVNIVYAIEVNAATKMMLLEMDFNKLTEIRNI